MLANIVMMMTILQSPGIVSMALWIFLKLFLLCYTYRLTNTPL